MIIITRECGHARISAKADGKGLRVPYSFAMSRAENHAAAAGTLAYRHGWSGTWHSASLPNGTFCHIRQESAMQTTVLPMA